MEEDEEKSSYSSNYHGGECLIMMNKVELLTEQMKQAILDSDEYRRYVKLNEELKKRPDLKRAVDEFRKQNFYYQYSDDVDDAIGKSEELAKNFAATRSIKLVNDFLVTEMCIDRMIQQICISLVSVMDFDVDFLDD